MHHNIINKQKWIRAAKKNIPNCAYKALGTSFVTGTTVRTQGTLRKKRTGLFTACIRLRPVWMLMIFYAICAQRYLISTQKSCQEIQKYCLNPIWILSSKQVRDSKHGQKTFLKKPYHTNVNFKRQRQKTGFVIWAHVVIFCAHNQTVLLTRLIPLVTATSMGTLPLCVCCAKCIFQAVPCSTCTWIVSHFPKAPTGTMK